MAEKKLTEKEIKEKLKELKIELLKPVAKRKDIKRAVARLLTMVHAQTKSEENKK